MTDHERRLAEWVADLDLTTLPTQTRERVGLLVADTVGVIIGGVSNDAIANLREMWMTAQNGESGLATVLGTTQRRTSRYQAAFLNGTSGTVLELDEGHRYAAGHPAIHVLPALLADAETDYGTIASFVAAFVAGYEAAIRVAEAIGPIEDGYHPHGVWGPVGGAAAVARYREYDAEKILTAMQIAANYAQHTRFEAATEGATVRNGFAGMSNLGALIAVDQAEAGFIGLSKGVARHLAPASADGVTSTRLTDQLGDRWCLDEGYFKIHAACRYTHPVLDAVVHLMDDESKIHRENIDGIEVETYAAAARLDETRPRNALQAKFSIPFAVATVIRTGCTDMRAFNDTAITDETLALAEQVTVRVADDINARVPDRRGARITLTFADGRTVTREVRAARGGEHDPFTAAELHKKFKTLVEPILGPGQTRRLWEATTEPAPPRILCTLARNDHPPSQL